MSTLTSLLHAYEKHKYRIDNKYTINWKSYDTKEQDSWNDDYFLNSSNFVMKFDLTTISVPFSFKC